MMPFLHEEGFLHRKRGKRVGTIITTFEGGQKKRGKDRPFGPPPPLLQALPKAATAAFASSSVFPRET